MHSNGCDEEAYQKQNDKQDLNCFESGLKHALDNIEPDDGSYWSILKVHLVGRSQ